MMTTGRAPINYAPEAYASPRRPLSRHITEGCSFSSHRTTALGATYPLPASRGHPRPATSPVRRQAKRASPARAGSGALRGMGGMEGAERPRTSARANMTVDRLVAKDGSEEFRRVEVRFRRWGEWASKVLLCDCAAQQLRVLCPGASVCWGFLTMSRPPCCICA